jgi:hypothetical protein
MAEAVLIERPEEFLIADQGAGVRCTEDRPGERPGLQIAGGPTGVMMSFLLEAERTSPGFADTELGGTTLNEIVAEVGDEFEPTHEACAGRASARGILEFLVENPVQVWHDATRLDPTIAEQAGSTFRHFRATQIAAKRLLASGLVVTDVLPHETVSKLRDRQPDDANEPVPHKAGTMVSIYGPRQESIVDTAAAWKAGGLYGFNPYLLHERFRDIKSPLKSHDPTGATLAATYYQASTRNNLPGKPRIIALGPDHFAA